MLNTTAAQVIEKVREIAVADPTHVYHKPEDEIGVGNGCLYVHGRGTDNERSGCIVGQALMALGATIGKEHEGHDASSVIQAMGIPHTEAEASWLDAAQASQDDGNVWEQAVTNADACKETWYVRHGEY